MSFFGNGGQNGQTGRSGGTQQTALLTGAPQLFVNSNQLNQIQFQGAQKNFTFPQAEGSQSQLQLSTGGTPLILQPPVNFVTDQLGLNQLITQAAVSQSQQNLQSIMSLGNVLQMQTEQQSQSGGQQSKQRVFTGMVTKIHDNFGFIDEEVFFQMGVVKGPILPKEGDRVLVEADFNPSMPFKWNATRVQIVNMGGGLSASGSSSCSQAQSSPYQQHQQQMMGQPQHYPINTSMASGSKAPPPPPISSNRSHSSQPVGIVSNPHSIYNSGTGQGQVSSRPMSGPGGHVSLSDSLGLPSASRRPQMSHMSQDVSLPALLQKLDSARERERKDRDRERVRERSRSKDRIRDRRDRSRERGDRKRSRSRSKSRERRMRKSPSPRRRSVERPREKPRERERDRSAEREPRRDRERSPLSISSGRPHPQKSERERVKRSRSRDTIKSSEGKSNANAANDKSRSISPRRNSKAVANKPQPRYSVEVPRFSFDTLELNCKDLKQRYSNLYVPSDFFLAKASWIEAFPLDKPFAINKPSPVHIFGRRVERIEIPIPENQDRGQEGHHLQEKFKQVPPILDAPDASCTFTVKVMLLSTANMDSIFRKSGFFPDGKESGEEKDEITYQPFQRLMTFVVGVKNGKHDIMALGGAWSASLDGPDPESNPKVLINTAIRCVKAMSAIDLTRCKYWYRFMELYYRRSNGNLETVVYFLPDLSSVVPSRDHWELTLRTYRLALYGRDFVEAERLKLKKEKEQTDAEAAVAVEKEKMSTATVTTNGKAKAIEDSASASAEKSQSQSQITGTETDSQDSAVVADDPAGAAADVADQADVSHASEDDILTMEVVDECNGDPDPEDSEAVAEMLLATNEIEGSERNKMDTSFDIYDNIVESQSQESVGNESGVNTANSSQVVDVDENPANSKGTHFSLLDPKNMNVAKLREELSLRNLSTKGLKAQLTSRLVEALKLEQDKSTTTRQPAVGLGGPASVSDSDTLPLPGTEQEDEKKVSSASDSSPVKFKEENSSHVDETETSALRIVDPSTIFESEVSESEDHLNLNSQGKQETGEMNMNVNMEEGECEMNMKTDDDAFFNSGNGNYPVIKSEMSPEEKKQWERRYALPKNPRILIFPAAKIKSGAFDCSIMPLSSLRDYRLVDRREESFEVSLFSEFFYEMIQRDFSFRIYTEIVKQAKEKKPSSSSGSGSGDGKDKEKDAKIEVEKSKEKEKEKEPENAAKRRKTSSASVVTVDSANSKEIKEKTKTVDPMLLLAFTFFDEHRCGHIMDGHVEEICTSLGLGITRHELQKALRKVVSKGSINYRKWTDKLESEIASSSISSPPELKSDLEFIRKISRGNKILLPVFTYSTPVVNVDDSLSSDCSVEKHEEESLLVNIDGQVVDVRKIKKQVDSAEKDRLAVEATVNVLKNSLNEAKNQVSELKKSNDTLTDDLRKTKDSLKKVESSEKSAKEDLETFQKSTERYLERIRDLVKFPTPTSKEKEKDKDKEASKDKKKESTNLAVDSDKDKDKQRKDDDSKK